MQHLSPERKINQVHPSVSSSFPLISERCQVSCSPTHGPEISIFQSSQAEEEHIEKKIITIEDEVKAKLAPSGFSSETNPLFTASYVFQYLRPKTHTAILV